MTNVLPQDLLAARGQMALSLAFHIVFAAIGMAMPFLMATAHWRWLRTGEPAYRELTRVWSKGVAIFFAIGAVSGTILSFELGLLWPTFMREAGGIIGMPFSWEGVAFFLEAVALGLFLYGWERMPRWAHWATGLMVGITGVMSAAFVVCVNAWMNSPTGFTWVQGHAEQIDPVAAMFNARAFDQGLHMILAGFVATGFAAAGLHASQLRRRPGHPTHLRGMRIALGFAAVFAVLQPLSGDLTAKTMARKQPIKLAAAEAYFHTQECAPMTLGGWPDPSIGDVRFGIKIPCLLSFLVWDDPHAVVRGLEDFSPELWPPLAIVHAAYQVMIGLGTLLAALGATALAALVWRRERLEDRRVLLLLSLLTPAGFVAMEAGWTVTEVGRQPFIIYGIMKTEEALTTMPGLIYTFSLYSVLYACLAALAFWLLARQVRVLNAATGAA